MVSPSSCPRPRPSRRRILGAALAAAAAVATLPASAGAVLPRGDRIIGSATLSVVASPLRDVVPEAPAADQRCAGADLTPSAANAAAVRAATLCLVNVERTSRGLVALRGDARLRRAAAAYSRDMVSRSYFSHVSPDGRDIVARLRAVGLGRGAYTFGENIAWGTGELATPAATVDAWMNSTDHRDNILFGAFRRVGTGVGIGAPGEDGAGATYTMDFSAG